MTKSQKPYRLKPNQAIIRNDTLFGLSDYFLVTLVKKGGKWITKTQDLDCDRASTTVRGLRLDHSNRVVSAYCLPGHSVREQWQAIPGWKKTRAVTALKPTKAFSRE